MKTFSTKLTHTLMAATLALSLGSLSFSALARAPDGWSSGAYAYSAQNTPLRTVLADFASSHGVTLKLGNVPEATVNGRLRADSAATFLDRLGLEYQFQWFVYNDMLYISPQSEQISKRIRVSSEAAPDLKDALDGIGLLEPKFGYGELPDDGVILVTGPPEYVALVSQFSEQEKDYKTGKEMMSFPLKYASVSDREIHYRDKTLTVPGVATILNELLGKKNNKSAQGVKASGNGQDGLSQLSQQQADSILSSLIQSGDPHGSNDDFDDGKSGLNPLVSADVRNNALLVRDDPKKREQYQALISQIDVPQKLIEIDALIVDVDRHAMSALSANLGGSFGNITAGSSLLDGSSTLFVTDYQRFFAQVQALEGNGNASIVANPSVLTLENQPAVIDFSQTAFISTVGERVANVTPVTAGTSLQVIPRAIDNGGKSTVELIVDVEDGKLDKGDDGQATGDSRAVVSTQAQVQEKNSLVMGGFHSRETGDEEHKIPILGSIPLIGKLFTSTRHETSQRERLFIITPHLVGDQVDPSRYIGDEFRSQLNGSLEEVQRRQKYGSIKNDVESAMRDLAESDIPAGFNPGGEGVGINTLCDPLRGIAYDTSHSQWFSNKNVQITVGVVRNTSLAPLRFDEASCRGQDVLAVSVWPSASLAPGQSAEIYVAYESRGTARRTRTSLLSTTR
ncbi:MAG: type III secretion system outer membrane ring subunit SctC [Ewingella americana]|jgi:type III secretion protein C|uniref:type III secretion system outer membrane ring subunit SctC n=1 Tax=Ewingella americana TaxID=41202 RepID=UPI000C2FBC36|nr:type III secretion system outer membrane ring subunit SctC [Ewingella americana]MCI1677468.1 type III secretion system outer membrane ring subunit SctC [Ewingella americana]MCI1852843.1 type III secretion system outer membrane ring subunit SctC [Ewingella americana]MCI1861071.1 type III secretion system outer membrane ring subunit SctC [Ewingella americana]MCI2144033.1 type III secretion system outer membrane ring subunit SctC [Ewingella americana]MCI2165727.1 type III secretion system oute